VASELIESCLDRINENHERTKVERDDFLSVRRYLALSGPCPSRSWPTWGRELWTAPPPAVWLGRIYPMTPFGWSVCGNTTGTQNMMSITSIGLIAG
jgi:hypothetical protein